MPSPDNDHAPKFSSPIAARLYYAIESAEEKINNMTPPDQAKLMNEYESLPLVKKIMYWYLNAPRRLEYLAAKKKQAGIEAVGDDNLAAELASTD